MLESLRMENYIMLHRLDLRFDKGLQVLTGETGAGKSLIAGALNLILGEQVRGEPQFDRDKPAFLEATFIPDLPLPPEVAEELGLTDEREVILGKKISSGKPAKSFLNGRRATNQTIRMLRPYLVDFTSQRDQILLFDTGVQLEFLDRFAGTLEQRKKLGDTLREIRSLQSRLNRLKKEEQNRRERITLYRYQLEELNTAGLKQNEDDELTREQGLLSHAGDIQKLAADMVQGMYEREDSVFDLIGEYTARLDSFSEDDPAIERAASSLRDAQGSLEDAVQEMRTLGETIQIDQERLDDVVKRLDELNRLKHKYRMSIEDMIEYREKISGEIEESGSLDEEMAELDNQITSMKRELVSQCKLLTLQRQEKARMYAEKVQSELRRLSMPHARFEVSVTPLTEGFDAGGVHVDSTGADQVCFLFAANAGQPLADLRQTASGGELSRILLTIKKVLADHDDPKTIVFDEIDSGIGGKTADVLGSFIKELAAFHQILCITHLPQIAARCDQHFLIEKRTSEGQTVIDVRELREDEKKPEIARMLSGSDSEAALRHAGELLQRD